jgi:hypothetical protein
MKTIKTVTVSLLSARLQSYSNFRAPSPAGSTALFTAASVKIIRKAKIVKMEKTQTSDKKVFILFLDKVSGIVKKIKTSC